MPELKSKKKKATVVQRVQTKGRVDREVYVNADSCINKDICPSKNYAWRTITF